MKTFLQIDVLAACVFVVASVLPFKSAWAQAAGQIGNIAYSISSAPNALDARAFAMSANDTRYRVMGYAAMTTMVQGTCAEIVSGQVILQNDPRLKPALEQFRASRASRDLPLQELLQVTGRVLADHCGTLQVLRVRIENYGYEGTSTRAGGWVLQDGHLATEFDARAGVDLRVEDATGTLRVLYRGTCEAEPRLLMEPSRPPLIDLSDKLFHDYAALATQVAAQYARQCRMAQRVSLALAVMPSNWLCAQPGECFMEARLADGQWTSDLRQLRQRPVDNPIADFVDMVEVLAAGRFDILRDYDSYVGFFAWTYFNAYSDVCRSHIRQPVARVTRHTSVKTDGQGGVISEESSETTPVYVEAEHAWVYDVSQLKGRTYLAQRLLRMRSAADGLGLVGNLQQVRGLLQGRCTDELTLAVQQNMLNHAAGKPPVTGKYSTAKKPIVHIAQDGQSAPEFTKVYLRQREERFAASAQPAPPDNPPPPEPPPPTSAPGQTAADLQRQYIESVARLEQDYRAQMQGAGVFQRIKLEAELKYKKITLERELRENLKRAQPP